MEALVCSNFGGGGGGGSTWVEAGLRVTRSVAVDLCSSYKDGLNPDQLGDGEWNAEAQVLSTIQFHLTSINPACVSLGVTEAEYGHQRRRGITPNDTQTRSACVSLCVTEAEYGHQRRRGTTANDTQTRSKDRHNFRSCARPEESIATRPAIAM